MLSWVRNYVRRIATSWRQFVEEQQQTHAQWRREDPDGYEEYMRAVYGDPHYRDPLG